MDRVEAVWNDLACHGFRHDLKRDEVYVGDEGGSVDEGVRTQQEAALPRNLLLHHPPVLHPLLPSAGVE